MKEPVSVIVNVYNEAATIEAEIINIYNKILVPLPGSEAHSRRGWEHRRHQGNHPGLRQGPWHHTLDGRGEKGLCKGPEGRLCFGQE